MKNKHAVALGRLGGSRATEAQKDAARKNGESGGRPKEAKNKIKKALTNQSGVVLLE